MHTGTGKKTPWGAGTHKGHKGHGTPVIGTVVTLPVLFCTVPGTVDLGGTVPVLNGTVLGTVQYRYTGTFAGLMHRDASCRILPGCAETHGPPRNSTGIAVRRLACIDTTARFWTHRQHSR